MKNLPKISLLLVFTFIAVFCDAQDKVYIKGDKKPIDVKVVEIGPDEIRVEDRENDIIQVYSTFDIYKIVFANGRVQKFESENDQSIDRYRDMNFNAFSIDVTGPLQNLIRITYDRAIKPGLSYELGLSYIGISKDPYIYQNYNSNEIYYLEPKGVRVEAGLKAIRLPNFVNGKIRYRHLLQGSYVKPWTALEWSSRNIISDVAYDPFTGVTNITIDRRSLTTFNLGFDLGKSWVASDRVLMDFYFGLGYSISNYKNIRSEDFSRDVGYANFDVDYRGFGYLRTQPDQTGSFILRIGLKVGYVFNWKKDAAKSFK